MVDENIEFDENKFRYLIGKKGKTLADVAKVMGISKVTLYRKMSGESDFYRTEMKKCADFLGIDMTEIFFAQEVSDTKQ